MTLANGAIAESLIDVRNLSVRFPHGDETLVAVDEVTFMVGRREMVAIVGESGSGKSMTGLAVMKLTPFGSVVTSDRVMFDGIDISKLGERAMRDIRGRRIAMIFQNPMSALNPVLTIDRQLTESLERHAGLEGRTAEKRALELLELVEVAAPQRVLDGYPHQLSGGMRQRVMIAIGLAGDPDLLVADEPTTALDVTVQSQILDLLTKIQTATGMAILFITHDLGIVAGVADRVYVMYSGRILEHGSVFDVFEHPAQPYTKALLSTVRQLGDEATTRLSPIPGQPPSVRGELIGCPFSPRCPVVIEECTAVTPELTLVASAHAAACHVAEKVVVSP
ncbi:MAG: ABC transporter ATP-binding protein [Actinobacteria bacterium]|nr:ABC transporter ATP-binding protein [Actinomycetota bacterium]